MTDTVTAVGPISEPLYLTRRMVALSPTFRSVLQLEDNEQALDRIFGHEVNGEESDCCVLMTDSMDYQFLAGGDQNYLRPSGAVFVYLTLNTLPEHFEDNWAELMRFGNLLGGVANDLAELSGQDQTEDPDFPDSHLSIIDIQSMGPYRNDPEMWPNLGRKMWGALTLRWGDGR